MIGAIIRAQLLAMRAVWTKSSRRGAIFSALVGLVWYGFWVVLAAGAFAFASDPEERVRIEAWLPAGFLLVFLWWQVAPVFTGSFGAALDLRKLLAYPIPRKELYLIELLLRLASGSENLLVLAGAAAGLLSNPAFGGRAAAVRVLVPVLLFILFNVLLSAGVRSLIERLFARRRIREVMVLIVVATAALPRLLLVARVRPGAVGPALAAVGGVIWPWGAAARAALGEGSFTAIGLLSAWCLAAWWFGRGQFERNLRFDAQAARAAPADVRATSWTDRIFRLPNRFLPDPLAAVVEKELRSLARTPRFRTVFVMGFTFGLLVWLPLILGSRQGRNPALEQNFLTIVSLYALVLLNQISYGNAFGFDRSAVQAWFASPVEISRVLAGKNLAAGFFIFLEITAVTVACQIVRIRIPQVKILEAYLVAFSASLYMLALGNLGSVHFPRPMNPDQTSQGGAAGRLQGLLFAIYPLALLPVGLAYLARWAFDSGLAFFLVLGFATLLGAVFYWIAMESAVKAVQSRREELVAALSTGEGPVALE